MENNHALRKVTKDVNGKKKTVTLKHLNSDDRNMFNAMAKSLYYDYKSDVIDGNDLINMEGILSYTDIPAAKKFYDEAYKMMQDKLSSMVATKMAASNAVSDDDEDVDE